VPKNELDRAQEEVENLHGDNDGRSRKTSACEGNWKKRCEPPSGRQRRFRAGNPKPMSTVLGASKAGLALRPLSLVIEGRERTTIRGARFWGRVSMGTSGLTGDTELLHAWNGGDAAALDRLVPLIYAELKRLARRSMRKQPGANTLQATALVNEAYVRLVNVRTVDWRDRAHFFAVSAQIMRWILVDRARASATSRRGGKDREAPSGVNLEDLPDPGSRRADELIAIDEALHSLGRIDERKARVVELRFFGGLSVEETAEVLKISPQSVLRDWKLAKAWLSRELSGKS
jgi:RNA polymerase sigma factor (TIGR02999 family)